MEFEEVFDSKVFNKNIHLSSTKFNNKEMKNEDQNSTIKDEEFQ